MTQTAGTLWKIMGVMGYEDAVHYEKLHDLKVSCIQMGQNKQQNALWQMVMRSVFFPNTKRETVVCFTHSEQYKVQNRKLEQGVKVKMEQLRL